MKARHDFATEQEWLEYYRCYAAAMAMQGMLAKYGTDYQSQHAVESVYMADELIKALNDKQ